MINFLSLRKCILVSLAGGIFFGALIAVLSPGVFWVEWLSATTLSCPLLFGLLSAWHWAWGGKLLGLIMAMAIFFAFFTRWYSKRYDKIGSRLPFWDMIAFICGFSGLVLVGD